MFKMINRAVLGTALVLTSLVMQATPAHAAAEDGVHVYVSATGSDYNDGSENSPWATLARASYVLCAKTVTCPDLGVPVVVHVDGTLTGYQTFGYTSPAGVTITSDSTWGVDAQGARSALLINSIPDRACAEESGLTIERAHIRNAALMGLQITGDVATADVNGLGIPYVTCPLTGTVVRDTFVSHIGTKYYYDMREVGWGAIMVSAAPRTTLTNVSVKDAENQPGEPALHMHAVYIYRSTDVKLKDFSAYNVSGTPVRVRHASHRLTVDGLSLWRTGSVAQIEDWYVKPGGGRTKAEYRSYGAVVRGLDPAKIYFYPYTPAITGRSLTHCTDYRTTCPTNRIDVR